MTRPLTIITQNLLGGLPGWGWRLPLLARQLAQQEPNIIALQEVHAPSLDGSDSQAHQLAAKLGGYRVAFAAGREKAGGGAEGVALLSLSPLLDVEQCFLSQDRSDRFDLVGRRVVLRAGVLWQGKRLQVSTTHLSLSRLARARTIPEMLRFLDGDPRESAARFLLGDLNADPSEPALREFAGKGWVDVWRAIHGEKPGRTWPTFAPRFRVDYLFAALRAGFSLERCERLLTASDHRGLMARLSWTRELRTTR